MHASSKKFILAFANRSCEGEVFYMLRLRYKILSLKIGSLPSISHTKRIHSNGKTVYRKTDKVITCCRMSELCFQQKEVSTYGQNLFILEFADMWIVL